jgi:hypothetical protein
MVDTALRAELLRRMERDQAARTAVPPAEQWPDVPNEDVQAVDVDNTAFLKTVVAAHGWPGFDLVGEAGANAAWLLVQHADQDPVFQKECLALLRDAVASGQAAPAELAYLTDRVRVADGCPQVYGTQYTHDGGGVAPHPIEDPEHLDERREQVGLGPHADYDRAMREMHS